MDEKIDCADIAWPIIDGKDHKTPSVFRPEALLREARRQRQLPLVAVPEICVLDPDGDVVRHLKRTGAGRIHEGWACYHTELLAFDLSDVGEVGIVGCAVGAPFAVLVAEQLFASGCRLLISVTSAGQITPIADASFDAIVCECALCTFPDKPAAVGEFARVLTPGGRVGLSDQTRRGPLPRELQGLEAWIACVADARPIEDYRALLAGTGLKVDLTEQHDRALIDFVERIRSRLFATEIMVGLKKVELPGIDLAIVKDIVRHALAAARAGKLGYAIVTATKGGARSGPPPGDGVRARS